MDPLRVLRVDVSLERRRRGWAGDPRRHVPGCNGGGPEQADEARVTLAAGYRGLRADTDAKMREAAVDAHAAFGWSIGIQCEAQAVPLRKCGDDEHPASL